MGPEGELLVSVSHGDDRAGIIREGDGRLWIAHGHASTPRAITLLRGLEPGHVGGPGWTAVGGVLPPRARTAQALGSDGSWQEAAIAGGAWVAFVVADDRHWPPPARFRDEQGALVSRADQDVLAAARRIAPDEADRLARLEASVGGVCPVCEARDWRGTPATAGVGEHVFCAVCGHSVPGVFASWSATATAPPDGS